MHTILYPPYEVIGNFETEVTTLVKAVDAQREPAVTPEDAGFWISTEYSLGRDMDRYRLSYEFARPDEPELPKEQVESALQPVLDAALDSELGRPPAVANRPVNRLGSHLCRRQVRPGQDHLKWHSGDVVRYLLSLGLVTEFVVGEAELPADYVPDGVLAINALEQGKPNAGDVLRHILATNDNELPDGLKLVRPKFGELVRINWQHTHQAPPNNTDDPIVRTKVQLQPRFY